MDFCSKKVEITILNEIARIVSHEVSLTSKAGQPIPHGSGHFGKTVIIEPARAKENTYTKYGKQDKINCKTIWY